MWFASQERIVKEKPMKKNPCVVKFQGRFAIIFTRSNYRTLTWVNDSSGKKMKYELVALPVVTFQTQEEAEAELRNVVIPYLIAEKDVTSFEIIGW